MSFLLNLLIVTLRKSAPLVLAAMGGLVGDKAGVLNIGMEGMMLGGAFFGMVGSYLTGSPWVVMLFGVGAGILFAMIHAFIAITCGGNQTVSGIGLNLFATGITTFGLRAIFGRSGSSDPVANLPRTDWLAGVPKIGPTLASLSPYVYLSFLVVFAVWFVVYKTPMGLRLSLTGENPRAAETAGIDVWKTRYLAMAVCGALCGIGGAYLSVGQMNVFQESMVSGRGFLAMAAIIMGKWTPLGSRGAALFFGFFDALQTQLQLFQGIALPSEFIRMLPYLMCLVALAGFVGRSEQPASRGLPYMKPRKAKPKKRLTETNR